MLHADVTHLNSYDQLCIKLHVCFAFADLQFQFCVSFLHLVLLGPC